MESELNIRKVGLFEQKKNTYTYGRQRIKLNIGGSSTIALKATARQDVAI